MAIRLRLKIIHMHCGQRSGWIGARRMLADAAAAVAPGIALSRPESWRVVGARCTKGRKFRRADDPRINIEWIQRHRMWRLFIVKSKRVRADTHLRQAPALALSGGERRRVEIARCLAADPKYLLLDEPFAGVDPIAVGEIRHLVHDLKSRGIGVLITDHNERETLDIVDRAYILHDGKVLMSGTTDEVVRDETVRRVYLGQNFRIN